MLEYNPEKHEYTIDGSPEYVPTVTEICCPERNPFWSERGAQRGTAVHSASEMLLDNDLDESTLDPEVVPYLSAFRRFLAEVKPEVIRKEHIVCSRRYWYAGKLDLYARVFGRRTLIDIKTGSIPPWAGMQLEAYAHAWAEGPTKDDGTDFEVLTVNIVRVLHLGRNERYRLVDPGSRANNWAKFLRARRRYDAQAQAQAIALDGVR